MSAAPVDENTPDPRTTAGKAADLAERRAQALSRRQDAVDKQHKRGKQTAMERVLALLDEDSFQQLDGLAKHRSYAFGLEKIRPYGDGVVTGYGTIDGRPVCVFAQDFTVFGGSLGEVFGEKIVKVMDMAMKIGCPVIGINDSGGARIQEGVVALGLYGEIFRRNVHVVGGHPADLARHGPLRRRRRLLARHHRLHDHGRPDLAHVHHRTRRHQDGHRRGRRVRGARWRPHAQLQVGCRALHGHRRGRRPRVRQGAAVVPAEQQPRGPADVPLRGGPDRSPTRTTSSTR